MKIDKKIIKELSDYLDEFNLTELEYTEKDTKIKVSKNNISINNQTSSNNNSVTIPKVETKVASGTQAVDIASMSAGAEAAKFGETTGLPIGTTYTHLRVTLNRAFTIEGEVNVSGNNWCSTDSADAGFAGRQHQDGHDCQLWPGRFQLQGDAVDTTLCQPCEKHQEQTPHQ